MFAGLLMALVLGGTPASVQADDLAAQAARGKELMAAGRFEDAIPIYRGLVKALPNNPGPLLNLGMALHISGQEHEAVRRLLQVLKLAPGHYPALLFLGAAYLGLNQPANATPPLRAAVRAEPKNPEARLLLGQALLAQEKYESAAEQFQKLTELDPSSPKAWNGLGLCYEGLASRNFVALEKKALGSPYWLVLFAEARLAAGYFTRSFLLYREALSKMPTLRGIHKGLAEVYRKIDKPEWAAIEEEREAKLPPLDCGEGAGAASAATVRWASSTAGSARRKTLSTADRLECDFRAGNYQQILMHSKGDTTPVAYFWRTRAYNELARRAFARLAQLPPSAEVHQLLATIHFNRRKYHEAAKEWEEALRFSPGNPYYQERLAISLSSNNEFQGAHKILEELIQRSPNSLELNYWLGHTLLGLREPEKALPYLTKALEIDPTVPAVHKDLARAYMQVGQTKKALPHLKTALPADEDGSVHYQLAVAYRRLGQQELANQALQKFRELEEPARTGETPEGQIRITPP